MHQDRFCWYETCDTCPQYPLQARRHQLDEYSSLHRRQQTGCLFSNRQTDPCPCHTRSTYQQRSALPPQYVPVFVRCLSPGCCSLPVTLPIFLLSLIHISEPTRQAEIS